MLLRFKVASTFKDFSPPCFPFRLYNGNPVGQQFGPKCARGDRIGCGIHSENIEAGITTVFFTKNGKEVGVFNLNNRFISNELSRVVYPGLLYTRLLSRWVQSRFLCRQKGSSPLWGCTPWERR